MRCSCPRGDDVAKRARKVFETAYAWSQQEVEIGVLEAAVAEWKTAVNDFYGAEFRKGDEFKPGHFIKEVRMQDDGLVGSIVFTKQETVSYLADELVFRK